MTGGFPITDPQIQQLMARLQLQSQPPPSAPTKITRRKFSPEEDERLMTLVPQIGNDWATIARHLIARTPRQCKERWRHYLSPDVVVGNWTRDEDELLLAKAAQIGPRWTEIAHHFPGRTDIGVKNRYIALTASKTREAAFQRAPTAPHSTGVRFPSIE
jgi:hypothetical protein